MKYLIALLVFTSLKLLASEATFKLSEEQTTQLKTEIADFFDKKSGDKTERQINLGNGSFFLSFETGLFTYEVRFEESISFAPGKTYKQITDMSPTVDLACHRYLGKDKLIEFAMFLAKKWHEDRDFFYEPLGWLLDNAVNTKG